MWNMMTKMQTRFDIHLPPYPVPTLNYHPNHSQKVESIYVVEYTDGDREDMDGEELAYAIAFYNKCKRPKAKVSVVDSESDEDESYQPSPKVSSYPVTPKRQRLDTLDATH